MFKEFSLIFLEVRFSHNGNWDSTLKQNRHCPVRYDRKVDSGRCNGRVSISGCSEVTGNKQRVCAEDGRLLCLI